ncbi:Alpha-amylase/subtilisin inhibitor [Morus notabilis]|uniref:Alpha-amylase/subtilisin inhibitor n=1 Tax=Morus notabilis TaxID=981085 RepID=W9R6J2_9ROSA|nr:alpha-amylase/subtilisin inhibitor [Morus notabilis]AUR26480.1 kunitz-type serine protease inhibitor [Morus notabilis]EXB74709.1 Alpha-amylase/subtilisin inhibitor [Morus notabilis]
MNMKYLIGILMSCIWLSMAINAATAQSNSPVLDTSGNPLQRGVEYYIKPAITEAGGPFTLVSRNDPCPLYVGQRNVSVDGIPVTFAPYEKREKVVRERKNFKVTFSAATICVQSTAWKVGETEPVTGRRLIAAGEGGLANYFYIKKEQDCPSCYSIQWCPAELCPTCRFICGAVGTLFENGQRLAALDAPGAGRSLVFERADYVSKE